MEKFTILSGFDKKYKGLIAGVDEAGRGPWAGPVVAAAVILEKSALEKLSGVDDSKKLNAKKRESLFDIILSCCVSYSITEVSHRVIDRDGILPATLRAMAQSLRKLTPNPDKVIIDGISKLVINGFDIEAIKDGDAKSLSIASASVLAKVHRDRLMKRYHKIYPDYGFSDHKGYGTARHLEALKKYGACPIHRMTYRPVKDAKLNGA